MFEMTKKVCQTFMDMGVPGFDPLVLRDGIEEQIVIDQRGGATADVGIAQGISRDAACGAGS